MPANCGGEELSPTWRLARVVPLGTLDPEARSTVMCTPYR